MSDDREDFPPPVDLSALDPTGEPDGMDALVAKSVRAGMQTRQTPTPIGVVRQVGGWAAPVLAAAGLVLAVSITSLTSAGPAGASNPSRTTAAEDRTSAGSRF